LRGRYKGAHADTLRRAEETFERSHLREMARSPDFQRISKVLVERFGSRGRGETPAAEVLQTMLQLADPTQLRGNLALLGLPSNGTQDDVNAWVAERAPELGNTPSDIKALFTTVATAAAQDEVMDRLYSRDAEVERNKPESLFPPDKRIAEQAQSEAERHNIVRNVARERLHAEAAAAPLAAARRSRYYAATPRHADIYESWMIAHGRVPDIDKTSPGYLERLRGDGATERDIAAVKERDDAEWVAGKLEETQARQQEAAAFEDSLANSPEEAADAATGGGK
jgi:hypothetical protein